MKTALISALAACALFAASANSFAGHRCYSGGFGRGGGYYGAGYGGYGYGGYGYRPYGYGSGYSFGLGSLNVPPGLYTAPPFQYRGWNSGYGGYGYGQPVVPYYGAPYGAYYP